MNLTVLGVDITFKPGADMERARRAAQYVEERYEAHKLKSTGGQGRETILTFMVLGMADELIQMKTTQAKTHERLLALLEKIEKSQVIT